MSKPHKGTIDDWAIVDVGGSLIVTGKFRDHPDFGGFSGHTSYIVGVDGVEIETRNSRYTLGVRGE